MNGSFDGASTWKEGRKQPLPNRVSPRWSFSLPTPAFPLGPWPLCTDRVGPSRSEVQLQTLSLSPSTTLVETAHWPATTVVESDETMDASRGLRGSGSKGGARARANRVGFFSAYSTFLRAKLFTENIIPPCRTLILPKEPELQPS